MNLRGYADNDMPPYRQYQNFRPVPFPHLDRKSGAILMNKRPYKPIPELWRQKPRTNPIVLSNTATFGSGKPKPRKQVAGRKKKIAPQKKARKLVIQLYNMQK